MDIQHLDKACEFTNFAVFVTGIAGIIQALAHCYSNGWWGNQFAAMWVSLVGGVLAAQSYYVYKKPQLSTATAVQHCLWLTYSLYMACAALIIIIGYALVPMPTTYSVGSNGWWAFLWLPPICFNVMYLKVHQQQLLTGKDTAFLQQKAGEQQLGSEVELGAEQQLPTMQQGTDETIKTDNTAVIQLASAKASASPTRSDSSSISRQQRWHNFIQSRPIRLFICVLGWSSIFWGVFMAFFLLLQAAWLAADNKSYPAAAYGRLVLVPIDNTDYTTNMFIRCVGPSAAPGLATFITEVGECAPAATAFGLQDQLAASGRRVCSYDRLGLGFSDDFIVPGTLRRIPMTLHSLLEAAGEQPPFILIGHGYGGQLALQYASMYPEQIAGLALLDSYSATAKNLDRGVLVNNTDIWGNIRYEFVSRYPHKVLADIDFGRWVTPLAWARFRYRQKSSYAYQYLVNALYGNNKAMQGCWGEHKTAVNAWPDSLDEQLTMSAPNGDSFWYATGWRNFSALPVVIMPSAESLGFIKCDITQQACQQQVLSLENGQYLAKLTLAYLGTLSGNASLVVMPDGGYGYPWTNSRAAAAILLDKFSGV